jgi:hypothetical protein
MSDAYFLKHLSKDPKLNVPDIDDEDIIIYLQKKGSGKYQDSDYKGRDIASTLTIELGAFCNYFLYERSRHARS